MFNNSALNLAVLLERWGDYFILSTPANFQPAKPSDTTVTGHSRNKAAWPATETQLKEPANQPSDAADDVPN